MSFWLYYLLGVFPWGMGTSVMIYYAWNYYGESPFKRDYTFKGDLKCALFWVLLLPFIFGFPIAGIMQAFFNVII